MSVERGEPIAGATDEKTRALVDRTDGVPVEDLLHVRGALCRVESIRSEVTALGPGDSTHQQEWEALLNPPSEASPEHATLDIPGARVKAGSQVRVNPKGRGDPIDMFLAGRMATVMGVYRTLEDQPYVAVTIDDDPGADLRRATGRFFYFSPDEIVAVERQADRRMASGVAAEPAPDGAAQAAPGVSVQSVPGRRVLVAGIGNIFRADDGFGPAVAARLSELPLPTGVRVWDVGVRGVHLAYELLDGGYERVILVDTVSRGAAPGTIHVIEPALDAVEPLAVPDAHAMGPDAVLALLKRIGGTLPPTVIVGCEPASFDEGMSLTDPVAAAVARAVDVVRQLVTPVRAA